MMFKNLTSQGYKILSLFALSLSVVFVANAQTFSIDGELKKWHKISVVFDGPNSSENNAINPFTDYRLDVTFTNGSKSYRIPGYYATDGNAAETSATAGNKWIVHFAPDTVGTWNFTTTFYEGVDIAINSQSGTTGILHNLSGSFTVADSDKSGRDFRGRGRLSYVGQHYLQFEEDSTWFFKAGADAPENTLAYEDFDEVPNRGNRRKSWQPHQQDYDAASASQYTWQNGKGTELLGVVNYLATKGVNAFSFLTLSLHGDDENVFPYLLKVNESTYNGYNDSQQWNLGVHHDRFDVSRMAQWERIFEYADKRGMYLHFKTLETENDNIMDNNGFGRERKIYYRELIARFGHHLALNWNLTEETTMPDAVTIATSQYIDSLDSYDHNMVLHTYPDQQIQRYTPLLGSNSSLSGASIQIGKNAIHDEVLEWISKSDAAGKKWVVANDEQGGANTGVNADPIDNKLVRHRVLWGTLMAGGAGVEYYYGYQTNGTDLDAQDHRTRDLKYDDASYAITFYDQYLQEQAPSLFGDDNITPATGDYVLTNGINLVAVYLPDGGTRNITLDQNNVWVLNWFNPRTGVMGNSNTVVTTSISAPDTEDWVALITTECPPEGTTCDDGNPSTFNDTLTVDCICIGEACPAAGTPCDDNDPTTENDVQDGNCNCFGLASLPIPGKIEAEDFYFNFGTQTETCSDVGGGLNVGFINDGDSLKYRVNVATAGTYNIVFRVASNTAGGTISYALDGTSGVASIINTGGWQTWVDVSVQEVFMNIGVNDLELSFSGTSQYLMNLNYIDFNLIGCTVGSPCDDNNSNTTNDVYDENCVCTGSFTGEIFPLIEAEDATVGTVWSTVADVEACEGTKLVSPVGTAYATAPETTADLVTFEFELPTAGTYKVFARTLTTNGDDDSFWVRANGGVWQKWNKINAPNYPAGFQWSQVGNWISGDNAVPVTFEMSAGSNTVDFAWRETGAQLDKIYVTTGDLSMKNMVQNNSSSDESSFLDNILEACPNDTIRFGVTTDNVLIPLISQAITIDKPLVIIGNGTANTMLSGMNQNQLFINSSGNLTIHNLLMKDGFSTAEGGAFVNNGTMFIKNVVFEGNKEGTENKAFTNNGEINIESEVEVKD